MFQASICMYDALWESLLNVLIGDKFISQRGTISTRRVRPAAIAVSLVHVCPFCR